MANKYWKKNYSKIKKQGLTMWLYWRRKKRKKIIQKDKENSNDDIPI